MTNRQKYEGSDSRTETVVTKERVPFTISKTSSDDFFGGQSRPTLEPDAFGRISVPPQEDSK